MEKGFEFREKSEGILSGGFGDRLHVQSFDPSDEFATQSHVLWLVSFFEVGSWKWVILINWVSVKMGGGGVGGRRGNGKKQTIG